MRISATILIIALLASTRAFSAEEKDSVAALVEIHVYRVVGGFSGDLSLTENIWAETGKPDADTQKAMTFFTLAKARLADQTLTVDANGWRWNQDEASSPEKAPTDSPMSGERVSLLAKPAIALAQGEEGSLTIGSEQTIEYFEPIRNNLYELKTLKEPTGLTIGVQVGAVDSDHATLKNLSVELRTVEERKPIEGVSLNVGEPVIRTRQFNAAVRLTVGREYGVLIHNKDMQGLLLMRLRVTKQTTPPSAP